MEVIKTAIFDCIIPAGFHHYVVGKRGRGQDVAGGLYIDPEKEIQKVIINLKKVKGKEDKDG